MKAIRLQTEYLTEPVGIDIVTPRFYWNAADGIRQTAYRIVCHRDGAEIWDSGKIASSSMTHIRYEGKPLRSRDIVSWSVQLWDENDKPGEISESRFEMGLLSKTDWKARWIAGDYVPEKYRRYPVDCFCKMFILHKPIARARLYVTARGVYDVTINGKRSEDFILAPGVTDYRRRIQYQTYDVTALLREQNTLELRLADGWYRGRIGAFGAQNVYGSQTSVMAQLEITYNDGSTETLATDKSFSWSNDGPIRFADLKDGEVFDAARRSSYSGSAIEVAAPKKVAICASNNVPVREQERFKPQMLTAEDGTRVLDFGQNIAGYLEFTVKGEKGQRMRLTCGEMLDVHGHVDLSGIKEARPVKGWTQPTLGLKLVTGKTPNDMDYSPHQEILFFCSGGEDHYKTSFAVFGFQYVQVDTDMDIDPDAFTSIAVYSDMEQTGRFSCSDPLLNRFVQNTLWSMKGNFLDAPTDCPTRERLGWTGDAQIFFDTGAYFMNTAPFFRKWLRDVEDAQYKNGTLPSVVPYCGMDFVYKMTGAAVGWIDAIYLVPYRLYRRFGDEEILHSSWPMIKKYVDFLLANLGMKSQKRAKANPYNAYTYEKGFHLGEWLEPEDVADKKRVLFTEECTAYLHLTASTVAEIAEKHGEKGYAERLRGIADGSKKAYEELFYKAGKMDTDRQAKLVRPLALGLLDGESKAFAQKRLKKAIENYNYRTGTGFLSTPFLLRVLTEAGETELAYRMLANTKKPGWLAEVVDGATTVWENWEGNLSRNHYSPGAVCQWVFDTIGGIRVVGENEFSICPIPGGDLTNAEIRYKSLYGEVSSCWEQVENGIRYVFSVPANTTAEIILPNGESYTVASGIYEYII